MNVQPCSGETSLAVETSRSLALLQLLEEVERDIQVDADQYLEETKVPYGGE